MAFSNHEFSNHETVTYCCEPASGLRAIIAIHDTRAGPAMGGCRIASYQTVDAALTDVLRLSRGMSYKNIMAGLPYGGGKAVVLADPKSEKTPELLTRFARHVERFKGVFITGEDVGCSVADVELMRQVTEHVRGIPENGPGDPSPMTARGVYAGIRAAVRHRTGNEDLGGLSACVQGLGAVGYPLAKLLHKSGMQLWVSDIEPARVEKAVAAFSAKPVPVSSAHAAPVDVFVPCALGGVLNSTTNGQLEAGIVAGAANNQLARAEDGVQLARLGILYAPDFVINAGGVMSTALEGPNFNADELVRRVDGIAETLSDIFSRAAKDGRSTSEVASSMAEERLAALG